MQQLTNTNSPLVSVTIPVYNVEPYLRQCVDSVIAQTYQNWECVLVDDGSTDNSGAICDEYAQRDSRIKVVHKKNGGLAAARQTALENIHGDYICALDADDWIDANRIDSLLKTAIAEDADIVIAPYYENYPDGTERLIECKPSAFNKKTLQCEVLEGGYHAGVVLKLIARKLFTDYDIEKAPYSYYEDMYTYLSCLEYANKVAYCPSVTYHYRQNADSLTNDRNFAKRLKMFEECMRNLEAVSEKYGYMEDVGLRNAIYARANMEKFRLINENLKDYAQYKKVLKAHFPNSHSIIPAKGVSTVCRKLALIGFGTPYLYLKK